MGEPIRAKKKNSGSSQTALTALNAKERGNQGTVSRERKESLGEK